MAVDQEMVWTASDTYVQYSGRWTYILNHIDYVVIWILFMSTVNFDTFRRIKYEYIKGNENPYKKSTPVLDALQNYRFSF